MANEPKLRKKNIEDYEDRVTILEGGTPEPHSNTMTKPELEDLGDRITVLEGGTPGEHSNPMRFEFFTSVEDRVEELEDGDSFSVIFETHLAKEGPGKLTLKDNVTFPEKYWDTNNTEHVLKDINSMTLKLDGHKLTYLRYVDSDRFWFSLPSDELAEIVSKYGTSFEGCPVEILAPAGIFELNGAKSKAVNMNEAYGVEHKPLWLVVPAEQTNYTLTYDYNGAKDPDGASISEGDSYPEGTGVELTLDPTHSGWIIPDGKEFAGWTTVKGADYTKVTHIVLDSDITVYALWIDAEPTLTNITPRETLNGVWVKPTVTINTSDPIVSDIYSRIGSSPSAAFYYDQETLGPITLSGGSDDAYILNLHISDSAAQMNISYTRHHGESSSVSGGRQNVYYISGYAQDEQGHTIDLSTITRPVYIPLLFEAPQYVDELVPSEDCADFACMFLFKETNE